MVFIWLQHYLQSSAFKCAHQKLASCFFGPYQIIKMVAYKLQLPKGARIHLVFHVSLLKKYVGDATIKSTDLPTVTDEGVVNLEPETLLDHHSVK